jgi:hypothetical protein
LAALWAAYLPVGNESARSTPTAPPTSGWLSEPAASQPALSKESALTSEPPVPPAHLDGNLPPGPTPGPPPSFPQRPGWGAPNPASPAGGRHNRRPA